MSNERDENDGHGGSYVVDPKSGKRKLIERTREPQFEQPQPKARKPADDDKE